MSKQIIKTEPQKSNEELSFVQVVNSEAVQQNIDTVANFFRMEGEETAAVYSGRLMEVIAAMLEKYYEEGKSDEDIEQMQYELRQLNTLVVSLKNPIQWVSR